MKTLIVTGFLLLATAASAQNKPAPDKKPEKAETKKEKAIVDDRKKTDEERKEEKRVKDSLKVQKKVDSEGKL
jgi:hypothetical protein